MSKVTDAEKEYLAQWWGQDTETRQKVTAELEVTRLVEEEVEKCENDLENA